MRNWGAVVGVALVVVLAYQGYVNMKDDPTLWKKARASACLSASGCGLPDEPNKVDTDVFKRSYAWRLRENWLKVECRRKLILFGPWSCARVFDRGSVQGDEDLAPVPQEIKRGVRSIGK
jgi:hypothetical protein